MTLTATDPTDWAGEVAVICVAELTVKLVAATDPNPTALAPVNPLPLTSTVLPPAGRPVAGLRLATDGGAS